MVNFSKFEIGKTYARNGVKFTVAERNSQTIKTTAGHEFKINRESLDERIFWLYSFRPMSIDSRCDKID